MQVAASRILSLNRRHPDARGLVVAFPLNVQRSNGFRDATGRDGSLWTYAGGLALSSFQTWAKGYGVAGNGTLNQFLQSALSLQQIPSTDYSIICQVRLDSAAAFQIISNISGIAFGFQAGQALSAYQQNGALNRTSTLAATLGAPSTVGVRYQASTSKYQFFLNGQFDALTAGTAQTYSAQQGYLGGGIGGSGGWTGVMSDFRLYNRFMPNDTFWRAYRQPLGIYTVARPGFRAQSFNAGRFFPFMHPSLSS